MNFKINNEELAKINDNVSPEFPKYTSQLINWANQNAQGTRPKIVGQLSELFPEYKKLTDNVSPENWKKWYSSLYPNAIDNAADKIYSQIENLKKAINIIDKDMIRLWVEDLVFTKTYNGLYIQKAILSKLADINNTAYRLAEPEEEAKGIDGYVGNTAYSVKPDTYKAMNRLPENIDAKMIYYTKKKSGITVEIEE